MSLLTASTFNRLGRQYAVARSAVLATGPTVTQNSSFFPVLAVTIASTYFVCHGGMARLSWPV